MIKQHQQNPLHLNSYRLKYEPKEQDIPCIIREVLFAPPCPNEEIAKLIEVAMNYHNSSLYQQAIDGYIRAQNLWIEYEYIRRKKELIDLRMEDFVEISKNLDLTEQNERRLALEKDIEEELKDSMMHKDFLSPQVLVYFRCAIGLVYQSLGNDDLAISEFMEAKKFAANMNNCDSAIPYSCVGSVFYHVGQFLLANKYFTKALEIRRALVGENNVDTAVSIVNVACSQQCLGEFQNANDLYLQGMKVLREKLGHTHPRTETATRNYNRFKDNFLKHCSFDAILTTPYQPLEIPIFKVSKSEPEKKASGKKSKKKK
ncbi:hypothetical protein C9374_010488 [Naegleria lovaniensis]|uniref:Tetratricopeptide repeat protein n=1 Tax=Naegleria lovaniensis TaxID=51637 RepID=A0AA88GHN4_NAELO|nr:uncharacterized protein C9374_010488 [Naegleria lovaniensis]KAG2374744.1 hypothetical protein C9374_010488 [Naegleria lovaniensis]